LYSFNSPQASAYIITTVGMDQEEQVGKERKRESFISN
jgi:hypothetical protein